MTITSELRWAAETATAEAAAQGNKVLRTEIWPVSTSEDVLSREFIPSGQPKLSPGEKKIKGS